MPKALIIIDLQKGFLNNLTAGLPGKIRNYLKKNKNKFDLVLFTQFINHQNSNFVKILDCHDFMRSAEYAIVDELKEFVNKNNLFRKSTYGSFTDNKVLNLLRRKKIKEVYIMGIQTENCVLTFARDAFDRGFKVTVLKGYCGSDAGVKLHKAALEIIRENIGEVK